MKSIRMTKTASGRFDILIENGKFSWAEDGTHAAQHAIQRALIFKGEYSLDDNLTGKDALGLDWYGIMFNHQASRAEKDFELKRVILQTPNIEKIISLTWTQTDSVLAITGTVKTTWGIYDLSQEIEVL